MTRPTLPRIVVAGLGDTGVLIATRLARSCEVVAISTRPALVSGQELGARLTNAAWWRRSFFIPHDLFRKLDRVRIVHGRVTAVDLDERRVHVEDAQGVTSTERYDGLVIATGASNGFWRHDRIEDLVTVEAELLAVTNQLHSAARVGVVGGGVTGVSVADSLARRGGAEVHLFFPGEMPLPQYHPRVRRWITRVLQRDGVSLHPGHRAVLPQDFVGDRLTSEPVTWSTGQEPFCCDVVLWAIGKTRPHSAFLPSKVLDADGFVRVDEHLRVPGYPEVFAVGDVAATDPSRSSARNWGWRVVVANVTRQQRGRSEKLKRFRAPTHRWGSVLGLQGSGFVVVQPNGRRWFVPRVIAVSLLYQLFIHRYLYGGLRSRERRLHH